MRLPFNFEDSGFDGARIKFVYTSPEINQNIEISIDGEETTVDTLMDAFQRFLGALGVSVPPNVMIDFVEIQKESDEDEDEDEGESEIDFTPDEDKKPPGGKGRKKK